MFRSERAETVQRHEILLTGCLQAVFLEKFKRKKKKMAKLWYKIMMEVKILKGNVNME